VRRFAPCRAKCWVLRACAGAGCTCGCWVLRASTPLQLWTPATPAEGSRGFLQMLVSPGALDAIAVPLLAGCHFEDRDADGLRRVIVNEPFAKRFFDGQAPPACSARRSSVASCNRASMERRPRTCEPSPAPPRCSSSSCSWPPSSPRAGRQASIRSIRYAPNDHDADHPLARFTRRSLPLARWLTRGVERRAATWRMAPAHGCAVRRKDDANDHAGEGARRARGTASGSSTRSTRTSATPSEHSGVAGASPSLSSPASPSGSARRPRPLCW